MDSTGTQSATGNRPSPRRPAGTSRKQSDPMDRPRALGAKRDALQARKHRQPFAAWSVGLIGITDPATGGELTSDDGTVAFSLRRTATGLAVEKRHCPSTGPRIAQAMVFSQSAAFDAWCDVEPVRVQDPPLHDRLRQLGHELLSASR